ncbi:MAG: SDR family oxidoreductase [Hyphomicrobiales bacterium]|nr:SDR family oxidoreductase [Hyphomicrobiales bacterium]MDE2115756.1 SDR family oxidoreductase [Hyphomicrobiales bacterium]
MKLLVFGLGYSASHFVAEYGRDYTAIRATTRDGTPTMAGVQALGFDGTGAPAAIAAALAETTHLLISIPPVGLQDVVLQQFAPLIAQAPHLRAIVYLSTIGVYGDTGGEWVDEGTRVNPGSERTRARVAAEQGWLALAQPDRRVHILRLGGIYGPGQNAAENVKAGTARAIVKPGQVFNRIHVRDIAQTIARALGHRDAQGERRHIWNVTDNEPAPPQDVIAFAAKVMDFPAPPEIAFAQAQMTPMARSFYGENRRVSNKAMIEKLHVSLAYPTYREGISALAAQIMQAK